MSGLNHKTPIPTEITLHKKSRMLEVTFDDGGHYQLPAEFLRVCSPSAEVRGHGRQRGHTEFYRGAEYTVSFVPKVKLELAVDEHMADKVIETIQTAGQTGQIGDGKIFVLPLEQAVRIRTGESGAAAL